MLMAGGSKQQSRHAAINFTGMAVSRARDSGHHRNVRHRHAVDRRLKRTRRSGVESLLPAVVPSADRKQNLPRLAALAIADG